MLFDITTITKAKESLIEYLHIDEKELDHYLEKHTFDFDVITFLRDFGIDKNELPTDNIELVALHLTSSNNECEDFMKNGIQDVVHVLEGDNALSKFLKEQDITFNKDYTYFMYDGTIYNIEGTDLYATLIGDSCVHCFLSVDDTGYFSETLQIRPQIITALSEIIGEESLKDFWDLNHSTYMIKFQDRLESFDLDSLSNNDNIRDAMLELIIFAVDMIQFKGHVEISVWMNQGYIIDSSKIIYTRDYYNN